MKNVRKNTFEGDMEQFILDAINDRSDEEDIQPSHEENTGKDKTSMLGNLLIVLALVLGAAGLVFYFTHAAPM